MSAPRDDPPGWGSRDPSYRWLVEEGRELPAFPMRAVARCSLPACGRPRYARGRCRRHYRRWWRRMRRLGLLPPPPARPDPPTPAAILAEMRAAHDELTRTLAA